MPVRIFSGAVAQNPDAEKNFVASADVRKIFRVGGLRFDFAADSDELCGRRVAGVLPIHLPGGDARREPAAFGDAPRTSASRGEFVRVEVFYFSRRDFRERDFLQIFLQGTLSARRDLRIVESDKLLSADCRRKSLHKLRALQKNLRHERRPRPAK